MTPLERQLRISFTLLASVLFSRKMINHLEVIAFSWDQIKFIVIIFFE